MRSLPVNTIIAGITRSASVEGGSHTPDHTPDLTDDSPVAGSDQPEGDVSSTGRAIRRETSEDTKSEVFAIPVTKGGTNASIVVDIGAVDDRYYVHALREGFKKLVNDGAGKITKADMPDDATRFAEAKLLAKRRVDEMYANKLKIAAERGASTKESGAVMTEARRIARDMIKAQIKADNQRISSFAAADITKAANSLLEMQPEIIEAAKANLAKRPGIANKAASVVAGLKEDPALVAKAEARKAEQKANAGTLSAKQASKVTSRAVHH